MILDSFWNQVEEHALKLLGETFNNMFLSSFIQFWVLGLYKSRLFRTIRHIPYVVVCAIYALIVILYHPNILTGLN